MIGAVAVLMWLAILFIVVGVLAARWSMSQQQQATWFVSGWDWLKDETRTLATLVLGGKGTGKSFAVGRELCVRTFQEGIPQIIIDPTGGVTDNFLQKMMEITENLPDDQRQAVLQRIWYVDMAASEGYVTSWPFYFRIGSESLYASAQRLIETILRLDADLAKAPVEGATALRTIASHVGMILTALGFQISEAESMLRQPKMWRAEGWLDEAIRRNPEAAQAVTWFKRQYITWKDDIQMRRTSSFRSKIEMYALDPVQRAIFGGSQGIDFDVLKEQGITLIVDFRHVLNEERLRFGMMWTFQWFLAQIRHRGLRQSPIHFCIDELSRMTNQDSQASNSEFSQDMDTLLSVEARNRGVFCTLMLQGLWQVDERLQASLLSSGNLMVGYQSLESGRILAKQMFPYTGQPKVKRWEPVMSNSPQGPVQISQRPIEYSLLEAELAAANAFTQLPGFHFLVRPAVKEGTTNGKVLPMVVKEVGQWVNNEKVAALRRELVRKTGRPLTEVLAEIEQRMQHKPVPSSATVEAHDGPESDLPTAEQQDGEGVIYESAP